MKKIIIAVLMLSFISCNKSKDLGPNSANLNLSSNIEKQESDLEKFGRELGFNVSRDAKINASNGLEFKNADDAKSFLKLVKSKAPQETVFAHLEKSTTNFAKNYQNFKGKIPKSKGIVMDENFSISNSGCGNWNNAIAFHTGFSMFSSIHFGANISNGNVTSLNSWLSGFTFGYSWNQGFFSSNRYSDTIETWIHGTRNYVVFWEGIGIAYQEPVAYRVLIGCNGNITVDEINQ
jgi:hypothetical protein